MKQILTQPQKDAFERWWGCKVYPIIELIGGFIVVVFLMSTMLIGSIMLLGVIVGCANGHLCH